MTKFVWTKQLDTGIDVIDHQHRRIVEYINQLQDAKDHGYSRAEIGHILNELVDYTISHFAFEESMLEEAGYPFHKAHKKVHDLFALRVANYQAKFECGEDVTKALNSMLVTWLFNHIKRDDVDYVQSVKDNLHLHHEFVEKKKGLFSRLFS